ncbi:hypothetical protein Sango_1064900 [Sesamum angolense]|uniref:CCHC-type domain-containing protein n=1 Tax=Sesamum angolense TaxID=2727404 RepID=A0AAE2BVV6_9LAMI|nr:hypothetical protein Sango_1064900 [Sesamum angolense]
MLDVRDMSEEDKLFNFMAGLKPWAQTELRRQGVKDLPTAIAAADCLGDYKVPNEPEQRSDDSGDGKAKFGKKFKKKDKVKEVMTETSEPRSVERPRAGCFICGNLEHRARDCPKRGRLNAIVAEHTDTNRRRDRLGLWWTRGPRITLFLTGSSKAGAGRPNVGQSGEGCELKSGARGDKPSFVKGEYDGGTVAGKKSGVAEARSSNASSSKEGAQSPRLAGFSCIGTMQEEMHRRWTKAQQIC